MPRLLPSNEQTVFLWSICREQRIQKTEVVFQPRLEIKTTGGAINIATLIELCKVYDVEDIQSTVEKVLLYDRVRGAVKNGTCN